VNRLIWRNALGAVTTAALLLASSPLRAQVEQTAAGGSTLPFRGTSFGLGSSASALSLAPGAELTYNPYVALTFDFTAAWWFTDQLYFKGALEAARELTQADTTTYRGEIQLDDALLRLGAAELWQDPWLGLAISGNADLVLPTSKRAQGQTRLLTTAASLRLSRRWTDVLGLVDSILVGYTFRPAKAFHRYTTASYQAPTIADCTGSATGCEPLLHSGLRNVSWSLDNSVSGGIQVNDWLGFSALLGTVTGFLYPLAEVEGISNRGPEPVDSRFLNYFRIATTLRPLPPLAVGMGASTINPQLQDDGSYETPLFNRYTQLFIDVRLDTAALLARPTEAGE